LTWEIKGLGVVFEVFGGFQSLCLKQWDIYEETTSTHSCGVFAHRSSLVSALLHVFLANQQLK